MLKKKKIFGIIAVIIFVCILLVLLVVLMNQRKNDIEGNYYNSVQEDTILCDSGLEENISQGSGLEENISQGSGLEENISQDSVQEDSISKDSALKAMVYMENNGAGVNGSIYKITEDEVIIVTTYHLLQNGETISVRFHDNMYVEGSVIGVNEAHDVGFVSVLLEEVPSETVKRIGSIQRNDGLYDSLVQGDSVAYHFLSYDGVFVCQESHVGTIGDMNWYVEDFDDHLIYNYCEVQPGMSGCAAVAEDGSYIGMVIGGYGNESAALSIRVIDKVYQELEGFTKS